jgi:hypothetical protein
MFAYDKQLSSARKDSLTGQPMPLCGGGIWVGFYVRNQNFVPMYFSETL